MSGLDPSIVTHWIPIIKDVQHVKQKLRGMRPNLQDKVKQEIMKLREAKFIRVANVVPMPKKGKKTGFVLIIMI